MRALIDLQTRMREAVIHTPGAALLEAIASDGVSARARVDVHRNHFRVSLKEGLSRVFPATRILIGERCFDSLAELFIRDEPPEDPCLSRYGQRFAGFVREHEEFRVPAFVCEVAELEWALVEVRNAPDARSVTLERYQRSIERFGGAFSIRLQRSAMIRHFGWPVHRIRDETLAGASADSLSALVGHSRFTALLLHRDECGDPCQLALDAPGDAALRKLRAGRPVSEIVSAALALDRDYPVPELLVFLVEHGLVAGLTPLSSTLAINSREN